MSMDRIDHYRLLDVIGTGGFATVYRAEDERFGTSVAIKLLAENHSFVPEVRERFIAEVRLLRRLAGIPTVAVYDLGENERNQPYAVMALANGDLQRRVDEQNRQNIEVGWNDLEALIDQLALSLGVLHANGIVHRDVKPSNLLLFSAIEPATLPPEVTTGFEQPKNPPVTGSRLLSPGESLRLADLGFAKDLEEQSGLTVAGGTPGYMPPEQMQPGRVDARADIYAATAMVVRLISGKSAKDLSPEELEQSVAERLGNHCSLDGLTQGLQSDPHDRHASMEQWRTSMRSTLGPAAFPNSQDSASAMTVIPPAKESTGLSPKIAAITAALCALALVIGFFGARLLTGDGIDTSREGDIVTLTRTEDDLTVRLIGPDRLAVDEQAVFSASVQGAREIRWVGPDGSVSGGAETLTIQAARQGEGSVTLIATSAATGQLVSITADFTVQ